MIVCSTISPEVVSFFKLKDNIATYKLRQNITESMVGNDFQNTQDKIYEYEESEVEVTYTGEHQLQEVKDNFSVYVTLATEQLNKKKELEDKRQQIKNLIDNGNYALIELNEQTQGMMNSLVDAMVSMSMNSLV